MKKISYGDEINNADLDVLNLECLESSDSLSANNINRPIQNMHEDIETNYNLFQNILKNVYGNENGVIPNVYEEFQKPRVIIDQSNKFLRIPFGVLNLKQDIISDYGKSYGLAYSGEECEGSAEKLKNKYFINDGYDSYTIVNRPRTSIAKRQMAEFINLDLSDLDNDIKIYTKTFNSKDEVGGSKINGVVDSELQEMDVDDLNFPLTTYYFEIIENSSSSTNTETWFPNVSEQTSWYLYFNNFPTTEEISLIFITKKGERASTYLPTITATLTNEKEIEEIYKTVIAEINMNYTDYYSAEVCDTIFKDETKKVLKITSRIGMNDFTNDILMTFKTADKPTYSQDDKEWYYNGSSELGALCFQKTNSSTEQNYYMDSISTLYGLFSKYSSYTINEDVSKKEFALEDLILIKNMLAGDYVIYLNNDLKNYYIDNGTNITKNVSPSKLFGYMGAAQFESFEKVYDDRNKPLKLFEFTYDGDKTYEFTSVYKTLDPNKLSTRYYSGNKLVIDTNTTLQNSFTFSDKGRKDSVDDFGNPIIIDVTETRGIKAEVTKDRNNEKDRLIDIFSPVLNLHTFDKKVDLLFNNDGLTENLINGREAKTTQTNGSNTNTLFLENNDAKITRTVKDGAVVKFTESVELNNNELLIKQNDACLKIHKIDNTVAGDVDYIELNNNGEAKEIIKNTSIEFKVGATNETDVKIENDKTTISTNLEVGKKTTLKDETKAEKKFYVENIYKDADDKDVTSTFTVEDQNITANRYDVSITGIDTNLTLNDTKFEVKKGTDTSSIYIDEDISKITFGSKYVSIDKDDIEMFFSNTSKTSLTATTFDITIPTTNVSENMTVGGQLTASQLTDITNLLTVNGSTQIGGTKQTSVTLYVGKNAVLNGGLEVSGKTIINAETGATDSGNLTVEGNTNIDGPMNVTGAFIKNGNSYTAYLAGGLDVSGTTTIGTADNPYNLTIAGNVSMGSLTVLQNITTTNLVENGTTTIGTAAANANLNVTGNSSAGTLTVTNALTSKALTTNGTTTFGTTSTNANLNVAGDSSAGALTVTNTLISKALTVNGTTTIGTAAANANLSATSASSAGALSVSGTTTVTGTMTVHGSATIGTATSGGTKTTITGGTVQAVSVSTSSLRALKKDIVPTKHTDAVSEINKIDVVDFIYKNDSENTPKIGFIADDTDSIFATPKHNAMDMSNCIGMLLKAVQELSKEIEELKSK